MKRLMMAALLSAALVLGIGSAGNCEVGVTDTEIHIGQWSPQTGPAAPWGGVARGTDAYFKWINDNGGIHGRKLVHHYFDDGYNPARTIGGVKQLQEQRGIFAWVGGVGTAPGLAVKEYLMHNKIPWIGPAAGSRHWVEPPQKYLFNVYPLYTGDSQLLTEYAITKLGKKRIAVVHQEDDYGKQGLEGAKYVLKKHNLELVESVPFTVTDTDMRPHIMRLKRSNADAVLLFMTPGGAARLIGTGKSVKYEPQWLSTTTCGDCPLMIEITQGLYNNVITPSFGVIEATGNVGKAQHINSPESSLMVKYKTEVFDRYASSDERWGYTFTVGIGLAEPLVEAIRRAGRDLTREKLVEELENMQDFKGMMGKVSYMPFDPDNPLTRIGQQEIYLQQCQADGSALVLTDWTEMHYIPVGE